MLQCMVSIEPVELKIRKVSILCNMNGLCVVFLCIMKLLLLDFPVAYLFKKKQKNKSLT